MATITINVSQDAAEEFRKVVEEKFGHKKGALGKAVEEAIRKWVDEEEQKKIAERQIKLMKEGVGSLKGWKFNREEIYDRIK